MKVFNMLIGLPGSGKSTVAQKIKDEVISLNKVEVEIVSSDSIRKELYGNEEIQGDPQKVFTLMKQRSKQALLEDKYVIYDACNINYKQRMDTLNYLKNIKCFKSASVCWAPYEICLKRNQERERKVPEYVITRMLKNYYAPCYWEGWDAISYYYNYKPDKNLFDFVNETVKYNQQNSHHSLSLGFHCMKTVSHIDSSLGKDIAYAGMLHDCGKPLTQTNLNKKGEEDSEMHYYGHDHAGGWECIKYTSEINTERDIVNIAGLVTWHMRPFAWEKNKKLEEKEEKLFKKDFYNSIKILHEADVKAH